MKSILKLTYECNNNCIFCHSRPKKSSISLTLGEVFAKIDQLKHSTVLLSGGEPTIRKDFFKIVDYVKKEGKEFGLITNGRFLSVDSFRKRLKEYGPRYLLISIHGLECTHDSITQTPGSFRQTIKGIKESLDIAEDLMINLVLIRQNIEELQSIIDLMANIGVGRIKISVAEPILDSDKVSIPDMEDAADAIKKIISKNRKRYNLLEIGWDGLPLCLMKGYEDQIINLKTEDIGYISETWEDVFHKADSGNKRYINKCKYCTQRPSCEGIYEKYIDMGLIDRYSVEPYGKKQLDNEMIKDPSKANDVRLVLLSARACCLNCKYCFVKRTNEVMSIETLKKSIDFLMTSERKNIQLQYFGGEPLMLPDKDFKESIRYAVKRSRVEDKYLKIIITTNSVYLDDDKIAFLEQYRENIVVEVSLDGDRESQNINRPQKNNPKADSYDIITKNFPKLLSSRLDYRISMVVSPETCSRLLDNFDHLVGMGFRKIWMMLACGVKWEEDDIKVFEEQLSLLKDRYFKRIQDGEIILLNLRDWFTPYRMNTELIVDLDEKIYPACMNYLIDSDEIKKEYCLGDLNDLKGNIDYYDNLRITNDHSISLFFQENDIIKNYKSNIKTGFMINRFVKGFKEDLERRGVNVQKLFQTI